MLVVMHAEASREDIDRVVEVIGSLGFTARPMPGSTRTAICVLGNQGPVDPRPFLALPGVLEAIPVSRPYKLVSRETRPSDTIVDVGGARIGGGGLTIIAGPCAIESEEQALEIARRVRDAGATIFRGGAFKPRTSPYAFQGLGEDALKILSRVREETGMPVVTEAVDHEVCELVERYADMIQIGARNMQNFTLLRRAGRSHRPVLLKRGMSATIQEWLMAAEYILAEGNPNIVLCERGVRTFADHTRNTMDLSAIPTVKKLSHLPVLADPSHAAGVREFVPPLARGAVAVGADGVMIEVHHDPAHALSDGPQALHPEEFASLVRELGRYRPDPVQRG